MQLYYTTSAGYEDAQRKVQNSTGGYRSSSTVKNGSFDNLFGEISKYTIREAMDEYIAIMLRNTTGSAVTGVEIWFEDPIEPYATFEVAAVRTTTDADNDPIMERTRTRFEQPFVATFVVADTDNHLVIGDMIDQEEVGIWIKRKIDRTQIDQTLSEIYEKDPNNTNMYRRITLDKEETHTFKVDYT